MEQQDSEQDDEQDDAAAAAEAAEAAEAALPPPQSQATQDAVESMLSAAASVPAPATSKTTTGLLASTAMRPSTSSSSTDSSSGNTAKRGKGRPPRKQNAILAAAKRQATKRANREAARAAREAAGLPNDDLLDLEDSTEGEGEGEEEGKGQGSAIYKDKHHNNNSKSEERRNHYAISRSADEAEDGQTTRPRGLLSHAHRDLQVAYNQAGADAVAAVAAGEPTAAAAADAEDDDDDDDEDDDDDRDEEEDDITSEAERLRAPLPPFPDDSADEDYDEKPKPSPAARSRGRKQPRGNPKSDISPKRSPQSRKRLIGGQQLQELDSAHDLSDTGSEAPGGDENARIIITQVADLDATQRPSLAGTSSLAQHVLQADMDADDAMSGVSEDIPILLQASAKAATANTSSSRRDNPGLAIEEEEIDSAMATPDPSQGDYGQFPNAEAIGDKASQQILQPTEGFSSTSHLPVPVASSRGRAKSPVGSGYRGRGRGGARGKGKARILHRAIEHEDTDAVASGNEERSAANGEREGSLPLETPMTSDVEDGQLYRRAVARGF